MSVRVLGVGERGTFDFNGHDPTALKVRLGSPQVAISIQLRVEMQERDSKPFVRTVGWSHALFVDGNDELRYDWHPQATPRIPFPHVHIRDGEEHIPTGRILVEDLLVAALEYGAIPTAPNWKDKLRRARDAITETAEWGTVDDATSQGWLDRWDDDGNVVGDPKDEDERST